MSVPGPLSASAGSPTAPAGAARPALIATGWAVVRHRRLSPAAFRFVALLSVWALGLIIVSGGLVRLTQSGLGCPDWPTCASNRVVAPWRFHAWIEFGNRLITAGLSVVVVLAVAAALLRVTRRRDLTWLAVGLVGGIVAEIVLGGLTVEHKLAPQFVMAHFLLAVLFLADAVVLHHRAGLADEAIPGRPGRSRPAGRPVNLVTRKQRVLSALLLAATALVVVLGTIVTSTGPHGGDATAKRFAFSLHDVAQLHGTSVELLLAFTLLTLWSISRSGPPRPVLRRGEVFLVVLIAQGGIGYLQYFTGVPTGLVALHILGATVVVIAALRFHLGLTTRTAVAATP